MIDGDGLRESSSLPNADWLLGLDHFDCLLTIFSTRSSSDDDGTKE